MMTISLASGTSSVPVKDGFNTQATVTATTIPEPASMVMFMTGMPLPLVLVGLLRRRRLAGARLIRIAPPRPAIWDECLALVPSEGREELSTCSITRK